MEKGAQVWCRDPDPSGDDAWILAEVVSKSAAEIKLSAVADPSVSIVRRRYVEEEKKGDGDDDGGPVEVKYEGVELANAPLSDQDVAEGLDNDLISLPHLHEPALLHAIHQRFNRGAIYTYTGPVIIAVNPFQRLPLYTERLLEMYRRDGLLRSQNFQPKKKLPPHVYSIADLSYRQMMKAGKDGSSGGRTSHKSQSILISGESGAGKTETTKIVMLYLTTLGSSLTPNQDEAKAGEEQKTDLSVMERVLQSNPILEAFGNARTLRNDNSSRFGKLIELGFSRAGVLLGAKVQTYLLEKVRVGFHASGERNYHIFYQLVRGSSTEDMHKRFNFHEGVTGGLEFCNHLHFTGQGGAPQLREFTDEDGLQYTIKAMRSMGWPEERVDGVLKLVAGMLHLGQVTFEAAEDEHGQDISLITDESMIEHAASLLGVDVGNLRTALVERAVMARGETIMSPLPPAKALDARDALAKTIYGALFLWVVDQVNQCIGWESDADVKSSIGVLDIFGFECFAVNSFEQLCINFTNEALQQQFNKFIFKMEQAEYESEKIEWAFISFPDNQDCLDLIQARPNGLLPQLDDECRLGQRGSDRNWANRLYKTFIPKGEESDNRRFKATAMQKGKGLFCVRHFAGLVTYTSDTGFLEKNKDEVALTAKSMFESAPSQLIRDVFAIQVRESTEKQKAGPADGAGPPGGRSSKPAKSKTVGTQFKEQLASLMERVESTEPHYIRCLKPNDTAKPKVLTRKRVTEQLRYGGVLEAVRVARMGYPVRMDHAGFFQRYRMLLPSTPSETLSWSLGEKGEEPQKLCISLVDLLLKETPEEELGRGRAAKIRGMQTQPPPMRFPRADVQLGLTKIFMRKPPHDILEAHRVYHQSASATQLQAFVRGMKECRIHLVRLSAARFVQRFYRGCVGRARWWRLREAQAARLLTNDFRMQYYRHRYVCARAGTVQLQAGYRGFFLRRNLAGCKVQTHVRMRTRRGAYRNLRSAIISLQCLERLRVAQAGFAELKREQKDIGKLKQNNEKMKAEMAGLKAMLSALAKGEESKRETQGELKVKEDKIAALETRVAELEAAIEKEKAIVVRLEKELEQLRQNPPLAHQPQQQQQHYRHPQAVPSRPQHKRTYSAGGIENVSRVSNVSSTEASEANAELIAEHKAHISRLEEELEAERKSHREADGEIIKLRAEINGVRLNETEVEALLAPVDGKVSDEPPSPTATARSLALDEEDEEESESEESGSESVSGEEEEEEEDEGPPEVTGAEEKKERMPKEESDAPIPLPARPAPASPSPRRPETPRSPSARKVVEKPTESFSEKVEKALEKPFFTRSPSDYFPLVRRGFISTTDDEEKEEEEVMAVGWQVEITSRKEREEALRDEVRRYEIKMKRFQRTLEEGVDVTLWQLNRNHGGSQDDFDEFALKATPVTLKLHKKGDLLVQTILKFNTRGGYLSKALGRGQKSALDPLPVHEILEIKAGCSGFDQTMLPAAKSGHKFKKSAENKHSSLFLTLKAAPNPLASLSRSYFLRFKSRSARNDLMSGLRGLLADLQIHEGIGISSIQAPGARSPSRRRLPDANFVAAHNEPMEIMENGGLPHGPVDVMIPLADVHREMNKERQNYDRLLLQMLQSNSDLKEKEDESLILRGRLDAAADDIAEKEKVQANDSKLIMQLSKKLEMLLMDNEDLRDQNDRLNGRLVAVECEKMNIMSTMQS